MKLDPVATLRFAAVAAWAILFDYLVLSGESMRFVGPRTQWVVPFGAVTLTLAALGMLLTLPSGRPARRPTVGDLVGAGVLVAPILVLVMVPSPRLGAFAVERKEGARGAVAVPNVSEDSSDDSLEVFKLAVAANVPQRARRLGIRAGKRVELTGLISDRRPGDVTFKLSRFAVSCCAADAVAYTVLAALRTRMDTPPADRWARVRGSVARRKGPGPAFVVMVDGWTPAAEPDGLGY